MVGGYRSGVALPSVQRHACLRPGHLGCLLQVKARVLSAKRGCDTLRTMKSTSTRSLLLCLLGAACGETPLVVPFGGEGHPIVNGTREPQNTFLTAGQALAVVYLAQPSGAMFCSGTLIAPRAVISAKHCTSAEGIDSDPANIFIGFGTLETSPTAFIPIVEIDEHPIVDFSLLILGGNATEVLPDVVPIAMNRVAVDSNWYGRLVDAAGYGLVSPDGTETDGRYFATEEIVTSDSETVGVDGHGEQGVCYGDSGGPIIYQPNADTPPVVVGTVQGGDGTCLDAAYLTRVDVAAAFVDARLAQPLPPPLTTCPGQSGTGGCINGDATWCKHDFLYTQPCASLGLGCGYLGATTGYGCLPVACGDVDYYGVCDGEVLAWCGHGSLSTRDCAASDLTCTVDPTSRVADCRKCACDFANASGHCEAGACVIDACAAGFVDKDGDAASGCEAVVEEPDAGGCAATPHRFAALLGVLAALSLGRRRRS